jgi:hypothetical protein
MMEVPTPSSPPPTPKAREAEISDETHSTTTLGDHDDDLEQGGADRVVGTIVVDQG